MLFRSTQAKLDRGYRMVELLKQPQFQPMEVAEQIVSIYAGTRGYLDDVPVAKVREFETGLLAFLRDRKSEVLRKIQDVGDLTGEVEEMIKSTITAFKATFR